MHIRGSHYKRDYRLQISLLFIILVSLKMTLFFPIDALVVWCPTWSKNWMVSTMQSCRKVNTTFLLAPPDQPALNCLCIIRGNKSWVSLLSIVSWNGNFGLGFDCKLLDFLRIKKKKFYTYFLHIFQACVLITALVSDYWTSSGLEKRWERMESPFKTSWMKMPG